MNIEEERKAFEANVLTTGLFKSVTWNGERYAFIGGGLCMTQDYFEVWLKAKRHAVEMAKPTCVVFQTMANTYTVKYLDQGRPIEERGFKTEAEAIKWTKDFGYRVAEE